MLSPSSFFDLKDLPHGELFDVEFVWQVLGKRLQHYLENLTHWRIHGEVQDGAAIFSDHIYIGEGTIVEPGAVIKGPVWIGENCLIRSHAYVREYTLVMDNAMVGHASETKGAILLPNSAAPHFNYVGDSVLGRSVNLGASTILSNLKNVNEAVVMDIEGKSYDTGLRKFGAILGDGTKTGCNSVFNPGCVLGKDCIVYPLTSVKKGYYKDKTLVKLRQSQELGEVRE